MKPAIFTLWLLVLALLFGAYFIFLTAITQPGQIVHGILNTLNMTFGGVA